MRRKTAIYGFKSCQEMFRFLNVSADLKPTAHGFSVLYQLMLRLSVCLCVKVHVCMCVACNYFTECQRSE